MKINIVKSGNAKKTFRACPYMVDEPQITKK